MSEVRINDNERAVLKVLRRQFETDMPCLYFREIARRTRLKIPVVRRAARSLARKGWARYERGLFNDDGQPAGSGYGCTCIGRTVVDQFLTPETPK